MDLFLCHCCGKGLLEIKCSPKYKDKSPIEFCPENSYHLYLDENNKVCLKYDSPWYIQIQGQMGLCKMKWCDFVFYTTKGIYVERIYFDDDVHKQIVNKSMRFYEKYVINKLLAK